MGRNLARWFQHCKRASHDEFPVNCSPWREHGHSDVLLITVPVLRLARPSILKYSASYVYGPARAVSDGSERYFGLKTARENPHHKPCDARNRRRGDHVAVLRVAAAVLSTIASSLSRPSRTRGARRKVDEVELEVARLGARGRQLADASRGDKTTKSKE